MLAELAMATTAMTQITKFIKAGKDLSDCGQAIRSLVTSEEDMRARGNRKKSSIWNKVAGKSGDDLEEFLALESIAQKRKDLEATLRLYAPPGTWARFVAFEGKMRKLRKQEAEERERQIAYNIKMATWAGAGILSVGGFYLLWVFTDFLKNL